MSKGPHYVYNKRYVGGMNAVKTVNKIMTACTTWSLLTGMCKKNGHFWTTFSGQLHSADNFIQRTTSFSEQLHLADNFI